MILHRQLLDVDRKYDGVVGKVVCAETAVVICRWAWCLPCGFSHIVPYFYVIYFGTLLGIPSGPKIQ